MADQVLQGLTREQVTLPESSEEKFRISEARVFDLGNRVAFELIKP